MQKKLIKKLKNSRLHQFSENRLISYPHRIIKKFKDNSDLGVGPTLTALSILLIIFKKVLYRLIINRRSLRITTTPNRTTQTTQQVTERLRVAIFIAGGVGDTVLAAKFLRDLIKNIENNIDFFIFHNNPGLVEFIFSKFPPETKVINAALLPDLEENFAARIDILCEFLQATITDKHKEQLIIEHPHLLRIISDIRYNQEKYSFYLKRHPALDGAYSDLATSLGYKRENILHKSASIPFSSPSLDMAIPIDLCHQFGLSPKEYITIHDGWDQSNNLKGKRPTKAVPIEKWNEITKKIKQQFPKIKIVQLGGTTGDVINDVDISLKGKISIPEAISIIKSSLIHIDNESGLVHLAHAVGKRSIVLFGPTSHEFFSYPENINIISNACSNCWWTTDNWLAKCPLGFKTPICIDSIKSEQVIESIKKLVS